jgi:hypothetical protein
MLHIMQLRYMHVPNQRPVLKQISIYELVLNEANPVKLCYEFENYFSAFLF